MTLRMSDLLSSDYPKQIIEFIEIMKTEIMQQHVIAFINEESKQTNVVPWFTYIQYIKVKLDHDHEMFNYTGKAGGGIVGITKTPTALSRYALSFNVLSGIASATKSHV